MPLLHRDSVRYAEYSPDGQRLVTASFDGTARVWDLAPYNWTFDEFVRVAQLFSGRRVDETGALVSFDPPISAANRPPSTNLLEEILATLRQRPKTTSDLPSLWQTLKSKHATAFSSSSTDLLAWHEREASEC
jgi:hypothetical protein